MKWIFFIPILQVMKPEGLSDYVKLTNLSMGSINKIQHLVRILSNGFYSPGTKEEECNTHLLYACFSPHPHTLLSEGL